MNAPGVLAAVVTHDPDAGLAGRLASLAAQAEALVVVDNGSADLAAIEAAARAAGARLIANPRNLGIAAALNQAAALAREENFAWLATFDHDSLAPRGALGALLDLAERLPDRERAAVLAMSPRDRATGRSYAGAADTLAEGSGWREVRVAISSGSLVRLAAFEEVGPFDEPLFIDGVDHDFCLRCRAGGWRIVEASEVQLDHSLGAIGHARVAGRRIAISNHSADRRYYMARNGLELLWRHFRTDPVWSLGAARRLATGSLAAVLFERDRAAKLSAIAQGAADFACRRFGPRTKAGGSAKFGA